MLINVPIKCPILMFINVPIMVDYVYLWLILTVPNIVPIWCSDKKWPQKRRCPAHFQISTHEIKSARGRVPEISGNTIWLWLTVCHGKIHHAMKIGKPISMDQMVYGNILKMFQTCKFTWRIMKNMPLKSEKMIGHGDFNQKLQDLSNESWNSTTQNRDSYRSNGDSSWSLLTLGYGSIPINTIFSGMNIHKSQLFDVNRRGTRFWHTATLRMATSITLRFTRKFWVLNLFESTTASSKPWAAQERSSLYVPGTQFGPSTRMNSWSLLGDTVWFPVVS